MKTFKVIITLAFVMLMIIGCKVDDDENELYYQFNDEDRVLLIDFDYQVDQVITYENQNGQQLHFKVLSNETSKQGDYILGTLPGGGGTLQHYYDTKIIRFEIIENEYDESFGLVNYVFSKNRDTLANGINFPMWNIFSPSVIDETQNNVNVFLTSFNGQPKMQMEINNHLFNKVIIVESGSDELYANSMYGSVEQNVNKIYYDYDFGVVRFDDIDGNEWKVIYPE